MKIGVDVRPLQDGNATRGIGAYLISLLPELVRAGASDKFVFIAYKDREFPVSLASSNVKIEGVEVQERSKLKNHLKSIEPLAIAKYELDVFLQTDFQNPVIKGSTPVVAVAYDLIPLHFKKQEFFSAPNGLKAKQLAKMRLLNIVRYRKYKSDLKNYSKANSVVAISQATADDFIHTLGLTTPIIVTLLAASGIGNVRPELKEPKNYLLYIGANEDRKNINFLISVFKELATKHPELRLKLVGHNFGDGKNPHTKAQKDLVKTLNLTGKVDFVGFVNDTEKTKLYQDATLFAFPSLYEGFGLPVLEAMQVGCPVVAFSNSSIPEVAGSAAVLAKTEQEFMDGIETVISNKSERSKLIKAGYEQAKKFSWEKTAKETLKALEATAREQV